MKIIFLDIDGVVSNSEQWMLPLQNIIVEDESAFLPSFDKECVGLLNYLVEKSSAKIVLSSSWRNEGMKVLRHHFKEQGVIGEIIDKTPWHTDSNKQRGNEIQEWLDKNEDIESFVILDDDDDMSTVQDRLVQTIRINPEDGEIIEGLCQIHVNKALEILNKKYESNYFYFRTKILQENQANSNGDVLNLKDFDVKNFIGKNIIHEFDNKKTSGVVVNTSLTKDGVEIMGTFDKNNQIAQMIQNGEVGDFSIGTSEE